MYDATDELVKKVNEKNLRKLTPQNCGIIEVFPEIS